MINLKRSSLLRKFATPAMAVALSGGLGLVGCAEEPPPPPPPKPPAPRVAPAPTVTPVKELISQMGIDHRISLPESKAPGTDAERRAVLAFFNAFTRGDDAKLSTMMPGADAAELQALVDSGVWEEATNDIVAVELQTAMSPVGRPCALAVYDSGDSYQLQGWYFEQIGDGYIFEAVSMPPRMIDRLYGDWIQTWHQILEEEVRRSQVPDIDLESLEDDGEEEDDSGFDSSPASNSGNSRSGGGGGGPLNAD